MLAARIPTELLRRFKSEAAAHGVTLQAAVEQAVAGWLTQPAAGDRPSLAEFTAQLRGSLEGTGVWRERQADKRREWARERGLPRAATRPAARP